MKFSVPCIGAPIVSVIKWFQIDPYLLSNSEQLIIFSYKNMWQMD